MRVALVTTFAASRTEPLADMLDRVHRAFLDAAIGGPIVRFNFGDGLIGGGVSAVDRVLKRHPELQRFVTSAGPMPGMRGARRISNGPASPAAAESIPYATLRAIAAGVPRSFPFHTVVLHLYLPAFGELVPTPTVNAELMAGVLVSDAWWVNGRVRGLSACTVVDVDPASRKLPPHPPAIAAILGACGKAKRTIQAPLAAPGTTPAIGVRLPSGTAIPSANPETMRAVHVVVTDYRARMMEILARAKLPHELPPVSDARRASLTMSTGPKKPALVSRFRPMGYSCRGESGTFSLRRRTAANHTLEVHLDVGTWSHDVVAVFGSGVSDSRRR